MTADATAYNTRAAAGVHSRRPRRCGRLRVEIGLAQGPALRPHPRPHDPRPRGDVLRGHAPEWPGSPRSSASTRSGSAITSSPWRPTPTSRTRASRGAPAAAPREAETPLDAAARVLDRAVRARPRHHRLRLGTSVLCHSYRSPAVLAKMAATLDVISEGRLDLGLGAGWFEQEYRAYGVPFPRIGERIDQLDGGRRDHPAHVDGGAPALPGPALHDRRRRVRSAPAPAAASADLDRRRGRPGAPRWPRARPTGSTCAGGARTGSRGAAPISTRRAARPGAIRPRSRARSPRC